MNTREVNQIIPIGIFIAAIIAHIMCIVFNLTLGYGILWPFLIFLFSLLLGRTSNHQSNHYNIFICSGTGFAVALFYSVTMVLSRQGMPKSKGWVCLFILLLFLFTIINYLIKLRNQYLNQSMYLIVVTCWILTASLSGFTILCFMFLTLVSIGLILRLTDEEDEAFTESVCHALIIFISSLLLFTAFIWNMAFEDGFVDIVARGSQAIVLPVEILDIAAHTPSDLEAADHKALLDLTLANHEAPLANVAIATTEQLKLLHRALSKRVISILITNTGFGLLFIPQAKSWRERKMLSGALVSVITFIITCLIYCTGSTDPSYTVCIIFFLTIVSFFLLYTLNVTYLIEHWECLQAYIEYNRRILTQEQDDFLSKMYSMQKINITIGQILGWEDNEYNPMNCMIKPFSSLTNNHRREIANTLRTFLSVYQARNTIKIDNSVLAHLRIEDIMKIKVETFPASILDIANNFLKDAIFKKRVVYGAIIEHIYKNALDTLNQTKGIEKIIEDTEEIGQAIVERAKNIDIRYNNGYSAPIIDQYAMYDMQITNALNRSKIAEIVPYDILEYIKPSSELLSVDYGQYVNENTASLKVGSNNYDKLYGSEKAIILVDAEGKQIGSNSILSEYNNTINILKGSMLNEKVSLKSFIDTGKPNLDMTLEENRTKAIIEMFAVMVIDVNFEMENEKEEQRKQFLFNLKGALISDIGNPNIPDTSTLRISPTVLYYRSVQRLTYKNPIFTVKKNNIIGHTGDMITLYDSKTDLSNLITSLVNPKFKNQLIELLKEGYKFGRMYYYLMTNRIFSLDDMKKFQKNYGRYYVTHIKNQLKEQSLGLNIDAFMQEYSSINLTMPIIVHSNYSTISDEVLDAHANEYADLYIVKRIADLLWYKVYQDSLEKEFSFNESTMSIKEVIAKTNTRLGSDKPINPINLKNIPNHVCFLLKYSLEKRGAQEFFLFNQYENFEPKLAHWMNEYFTQVFTPTLITEITIHLPVSLKQRLNESLFKEMIKNYRHQYIINLIRFQCLKELGNVNITPDNTLKGDAQARLSPSFDDNFFLFNKMPKWNDANFGHTIQSIAQSFNPALMHSMNTTANNFRFFMYQSVGMWRMDQGYQATSRDMHGSNISGAYNRRTRVVGRPYQQVEKHHINKFNFKREMLDAVCFKQKHDTTVSTQYLENRIHQNFMYDKNTVTCDRIAENYGFTAENYIPGRYALCHNQALENHVDHYQLPTDRYYTDMSEKSFNNALDQERRCEDVNRIQIGYNYGGKVKWEMFYPLGVAPDSWSHQVSWQKDIMLRNQTCSIFSLRFQPPKINGNIIQSNDIELLHAPSFNMVCRQKNITEYEVDYYYTGNFKRYTKSIISHYVMENYDLNENTVDFLQNTILLNKPAKLLTKNNNESTICPANLATAHIFKTITDLLSTNRSAPIITPATRLLSNEADASKLMTDNHLSPPRALYYTHSRNLLSDSISIVNPINPPESNNFTKWVCRKISDFMMSSASRYEKTVPDSFAKANARMNLNLVTNRFNIAYNPFAPYNSMKVNQNNNLKNFTEQSVIKLVQERMYNRAGIMQSVSGSTIGIMLSYFANRIGWSELGVRNATSDINIAPKQMDVIFKDLLGFDFNYRLNNVWSKFIDAQNIGQSLSPSWVKPTFINKDIHTGSYGQSRPLIASIPRVQYAQNPNLLYILSRTNGLSLNYLHMVAQDLKRFGRDMEYSFRRDSEYWNDKDPYFWCCYYPEAETKVGYNFQGMRGEGQDPLRQRVLRYQNYIENLRPDDQAITAANIANKIPDCKSVYLAPTEVMSFREMHDACSEHFKKTIDSVVQQFKDDPLSFFDADKAITLCSQWDEVKGKLEVRKIETSTYDFEGSSEVQVRNALDLF